MDNDQSSQEVPPAGPTVDWTSYHENNEAPVDVGAMAALVRRVGGELSKIDNQSVSNSSQKAERIDKQKLINELQSRQPTPPPPDTQQEARPVAPPPTLTRKPPPPPPILQSPPPSHETDVIQNLQKRLDRLESATRAFKKAKKIKRGASYKVSSNSVKGVIKDADLVAEFVISELAKGVKSITIKLDESTDTQ
jgi:hypothetical protein